MNTQNPINDSQKTDTAKKGNGSRRTWILALLAMVCTVISFIYRYQSGGSDPAKSLSKLESTQTEYPYSLDDVNLVLDDQLKGWNAGNIDQFMEGYIKDSSVRFITDKKIKNSWQEITDSYKKGYPNKDAMGKLTFHRDEIRWVNRTAYIAQVIGRWEVIQKHKEAPVNGSLGSRDFSLMEMDNKIQPTHDTLSGRFSLIFVGTQNGPKIQIDHTW
jgi:hypothetical protein